MNSVSISINHAEFQHLENVINIKAHSIFLRFSGSYPGYMRRLRFMVHRRLSLLSALYERKTLSMVEV